MRILHPQFRCLLSLAMALSLFLAPLARAKTAPTVNPQAGALQAQADAINATGKTMAQQQAALQGQVKQLMQQEQQDSQDKSRRQQQQTAAALGAMGAAIAGMGCIMGMKAAKEQTDPSTKSMMMMMAMQQCSQAAQSAAAAAKNDSGQQTMANNSEPTASPFETVSVPTTAASTDSSSNPTAAPTAVPSQIAQNVDQPAAAFDPKATATPVASADATKIAANADSTSALAPIPNAGTTYDETAKAGNGSVGSSSGVGGSALVSQASKGSTMDDVLSKLSDVVNGKARAKNENAEGDFAAGGGVGGTGSGENSGTNKEDGEKDNGMAALAGMMGPQGAVGGGPREDVVFFRPPAGGAAANGQRPPNIFQYASYRMKKVTKEGGVGKGARRPADRALASRPDPTPAPAPKAPTAAKETKRPELLAVKP